MNKLLILSLLAAMPLLAETPAPAAPAPEQPAPAAPTPAAPAVAAPAPEGPSVDDLEAAAPKAGTEWNDNHRTQSGNGSRGFDNNVMKKHQDAKACERDNVHGDSFKK